MGPDSRCVASEAGSFIHDESPELLTFQVTSSAPFLSKDDLWNVSEVEEGNLIN